jgi:hypothetical protein
MMIPWPTTETALTVTFHTSCPDCGKPADITVARADVQAYDAGALIQEAFHALDAAAREQLQSGVCPSCWDALFAEPE